MPKIYNEIIIDMNPESSTFEEILYEDSFEYSGDMMLASKKGDVVYVKQSEGNYKQMIYKGADTWEAAISPTYLGHGKGFTTEEDTYTEVPQGHTGPVFETDQEFQEYSSHLLESTDFGAENISASDFIDEDGNSLSIEKVSANLHKKFGGDLTEIRKKVEEFAPKFQAVPQEEKDQLAKTKKLAEKEAGLGLQAAERAKEKDVYGLQKEGSKVGAAMRGAYGGMGGGMRAGMEGTAQMKKEFGMAQEQYGAAQDVYGLARERADFAEETGLYDLEKGAREAYEADIAGFVTEGGFGREGGYVPKRGETFLDLLTQLPEAGGS